MINTKRFMINTKDQEDLFKLISRYLNRDVECYAIGGTAMMFFGYKNATKDIDLVFKTKEELKDFINAISKLGYKQVSIKELYPKKRTSLKNKPLMFTRGDERFDLFQDNVFGFKITEGIRDNFFSRQDFITKRELIVKVLSKEIIILLKTVTSREQDFEDIKTIIEQDKDINWDYIINNAIAQKKKNPWILIDLEEIMQGLKEITFIPSKYFEKIYKAKN